MSQFADYDAPANYAIVGVYGDGNPVVVACLRCDWESGKGTREGLLKPSGPVWMHDRDKHGLRVTPPGETR